MLLLILALVDLRTELRLLADQLTITSLIFAVRHHSLAVVVLVAELAQALVVLHLWTLLHLVGTHNKKSTKSHSSFVVSE